MMYVIWLQPMMLSIIFYDVSPKIRIDGEREAAPLRSRNMEFYASSVLRHITASQD